MPETGIGGVVRRMGLPLPVRLVLLFFFSITVLGKGPTYLALPPFYIAEIALLCGLIWLVDREGVAGAFSPGGSFMSVSIWLFIAVGTGVLAFCVGEYGMDAVRDAAIWYYALFYFIGRRLARDSMGNRVWNFLLVAWALALIWGTADQLAYMLFNTPLSTFGPTIPWRGEKVLFNSTNELVEHMVLASLIVFNPRLHRGRFGQWRPSLAAVALVALGVIAVSRGRGVKVGVILSVLLLTALWFAPGRRLVTSRRVAAALLVVVVVCTAGLVFYTDTFLKATQLDRFAHADPSSASGTAYWRLIWWKRLWAEVNDVNPAFGLGFGQSLNIYNPYLHGDENNAWPVRSPHNFNMTVFSRMGYIGAALWGTILVTGVGGLFIRAWRGHTPDGEPYHEWRRDELTFWIAMLVITWGNATFGVLMEGPVLGTWFWFGLGFAWARAQTSGLPRVAEARRRWMAYPPEYAYNERGGVIV
jgi:hypothetical protein